MSKAKATTKAAGVTPGSEVAVLAGYAIATFDEHQLAEVVASNLGGGAVSEFDFPRLKVPVTGAPCKWTVETLDGEEQIAELEGVVVGWTEKRNYWPTAYEESGGGEPSQCSSPDGITGFGDPGGDCSACPLGKFGAKGERPLCRQSRVLAILRPDAILPSIVQVPPTSLKNVRKFFMGLTSQGVKYSDVVVKLSLQKGPKSNVIVPKAAGRLTGGDLARVKPILDQMTETLRRMQVTPSDDE